MPFVYLLLFALVCLQTTWPEVPGWLKPEGCAILVVAMVVWAWLIAAVMARFLAWQLAHHPEQRSAVLRRFARWRRWHFIGLVAAFLAALYFLGWGDVLVSFWKLWTPEAMQSEGNYPGLNLALLIPFFAGLITSWERFYLVEKTAYELTHHDDRFVGKFNYLLMQIRHQFFMVLPPILVMLLLQLLYLFFPERDTNLPAIVMATLMALSLIFMPMLLRFFLGLKPLPDGPLRQRLEGTARRLGFRFSNILVWHTRHLFANALVTGFIPWVRYVVLTDRLIEELTPEEIEAVFGHEVGHIKYHHLFFYLAFFLTSFILLGAYWDMLKEWLKPDILAYAQSMPYLGDDINASTLSALSPFGKLTILAGYTLLVFGFLSRRCERQADLYGAATVSTEAFINALEKVAAINGIPRDRAGNWLLSWQHPTIAQRVEFLEAMRDHPSRVPIYHLSIFLLRWAFFVALGVLVWSMGLPKMLELLGQF
jgi:Zn-dependent protease with chaperone function